MSSPCPDNRNPVAVPMATGKDFPADVCLQIFGFLFPKDLNSCSSTCGVWKCLLDAHLWPGGGTRADYLAEQCRRYRWRKGYYFAATVNSVLQEHVHVFRICGRWLLTSAEDPLCSCRFWGSYVAIYDLQTCLKVFNIDEEGQCFDLRRDVLVIGGQRCLAFYDTQRLPTVSPRMVDRRYWGPCRWVHVSHGRHVLSLHNGGDLWQWSADGRSLRRLLDGLSPTRWQIWPHPQGEQVVALAQGRVMLLAGLGVANEESQEWQCFAAPADWTAPVALGVVWEDPKGPGPIAISQSLSKICNPSPTLHGKTVSPSSTPCVIWIWNSIWRK